MLCIIFSYNLLYNLFVLLWHQRQRRDHLFWFAYMCNACMIPKSVHCTVLPWLPVRAVHPLQACHRAHDYILRHSAWVMQSIISSAEVRFTSAVDETNSSCTLQEDERRLCSFLHINIPKQVVQSDWSCTWLQSDPLKFCFSFFFPPK